jgi:hypothetical protein
MILRDMVAAIGRRRWKEIAKSLPGRNARQCRERWKHYLSCDKTEVPWTAEEDDLLFEKISLWGAKWTRVARLLGNRTDLEVKMRWLKKFNHLHPLLPKSKRLEGENQTGPSTKTQNDDSEGSHHDPADTGVNLWSLRDEWLGRSGPAPVLGQWEVDWTWQ